MSKAPFHQGVWQYAQKNNKISSIMHDGAETQEIVEAFAEHDFHA